MSLSPNLQVTKNLVKRFYPLGTKSDRKEFDWKSILGLFISEVYGKKLKVDSLSEFKDICEKEFKNRLDEESFWDVVVEMYFDSSELLQIAPEFLLFRSEEVQDNKHNQRVGNMFVNFLELDFQLSLAPIRLNFVEQVIFDILKNEALETDFPSKKNQARELSYLPFLTACFNRDLSFLGTRPRYLLENLESFLRLYGFLYTSQLAHSMYNWSDGTPEPKPTYLILDTEKASAERHYLKDAGYKQLYKHVHRVFPYLSMTEMLQTGREQVLPLWKLASELEDSEENKVRLTKFAEEFVDERGLTDITLTTSPNVLSALGEVLTLAEKQFRTGNKNKDDINSNFAKASLKHFCSDFVQQRGAAGSVLVINQDYLLLLTNLTIGADESVRLNELLKRFNQRGVFFDKQSQTEIVQFYERIGNVERMSDSGDAVYVRKTI